MKSHAQRILESDVGTATIQDLIEQIKAMDGANEVTFHFALQNSLGISTPLCCELVDILIETCVIYRRSTILYAVLTDTQEGPSVVARRIQTSTAGKALATAQRSAQTVHDVAHTAHDVAQPPGEALQKVQSTTQEVQPADQGLSPEVRKK